MGAWGGTLLSSSRTVCLQSESVFAVEEAAEREAEAEHISDGCERDLGIYQIIHEPEHPRFLRSFLLST